MPILDLNTPYILNGSDGTISALSTYISVMEGIEIVFDSTRSKWKEEYIFIGLVATNPSISVS